MLHKLRAEDHAYFGYRYTHLGHFADGFFAVTQLTHANQQILNVAFFSNKRLSLYRIPLPFGRDYPLWVYPEIDPILDGTDLRIAYAPIRSKRLPVPVMLFNEPVTYAASIRFEQL